MEKCIVVIDLHCDPTIPSGAADLGGGNTYSRSLLKNLRQTTYQVVYFTRKKFPHLESAITLFGNIAFYRLDLGDWGPVDKDVLQEHLDTAREQILTILAQYTAYEFIFHSSYWQSGILAIELAQKYNTFFVHTILSSGKRKQLLAATDNVPGRIKAEDEIFTQAKYLLCSSHSEVEDMINLYNVPASKVLLAGLLVEECYNAPAYLATGKIKINAMGSPAQSPLYIWIMVYTARQTQGLRGGKKNPSYTMAVFMKIKALFLLYRHGTACTKFWAPKRLACGSSVGHPI